jgi:hypothetical protein
LVFVAGSESDGNRGNSCYGAHGLRAWEAFCKGLQGGPRGPRKSPRKDEAQERAREGKERCGLCLRKKKERKKKESKDHLIYFELLWGPIRALIGPYWAP